MKVYTFRKILAVALFALLLLCGISAATWDEMKENGAVSDGGIRLGDARDGIVSDVSDKGDNGVIGDIVTDASDMLGGDMGGTGTAPAKTTGRGDNTPGDIPQTSGMNGSSGSGAATGGTESGGMSMGIIIAILVVIAVIVIIFLLLPKRR